MPAVPIPYSQRPLTVRELRRLLFEIDDQDAPILLAVREPVDPLAEVSIVLRHVAGVRAHDAGATVLAGTVAQ